MKWFRWQETDSWYLATKQQDGWETLVFNIPEGKDEDGVYNTFVIIMTRFETAAGVSYLDNIDFSTPAEVIIPDAPQHLQLQPTPLKKSFLFTVMYILVLKELI